MNAAAAIETSLDVVAEDWRLEHELQTACGATALSAAAISLSVDGIGAIASSSTLGPVDACLAREAPIVLFLAGIGVACLPAFPRRRDPVGPKAP